MTQHDCSDQWSGEGGHLTAMLPLLDVLLLNELEISRIAGSADADSGLLQLSAQHPSLLIVLSRGAEGLCAAPSHTTPMFLTATPLYMPMPMSMSISNPCNQTPRTQVRGARRGAMGGAGV